MKHQNDQNTDGERSYLAIGLSLGTMAGVLMDNIGLGLMMGVMLGVSVGPAMGVLRKGKKSEEQKDNDEKQ